ncbi:unnamed protein product [Prorocentrum cordatum]|uniref:Reverse transcriptase domain-containing protein n=1 Tax=Prorocentrum cordatum TaxID=2364126 RepID=A0ABN9SK37_9DINO|nr:unnamed protein product [Polarella glacialis]
MRHTSLKPPAQWQAPDREARQAYNRKLTDLDHRPTATEYRDLMLASAQEHLQEERIARKGFSTSPALDRKFVDCTEAKRIGDHARYKVLCKEIHKDIKLAKKQHIRDTVVLLFKNKGSAANLDNYRPISLLNSFYKLIAGVLKVRIAKKVDHLLQPTQFGFRARRSTSQALKIVRQMVHQGASTRNYKQGSPLYLLFLDWEKAFGRVTHEALLSALERMQLPATIVNVVKALYRNPTFQVGMDNYESKWHRQDAGIRQGCPLSPYLFLITQRLDGFQLKGLRKILGISTTFGQVAQGQDRTNTNEYIYSQAQKALNSRRPHKALERFSATYEKTQA